VAYFQQLFSAGDRYSFKFIVEFFLRDLDSSLGTSDIAKMFRYDGLYDGSGQAKAAYWIWEQKLGLPRI